jgi:hypothetical protein
MSKFSLTLAASFRAYAEEQIEADTLEQAIEAAKALDFDDFEFRLDDQPACVCDELIMLSPVDAGLSGTQADDIEIPMHAAGEPYSWDAVAFLRDVAAVGPGCGPNTLYGFVRRAKALLAEGRA